MSKAGEVVVNRNPITAVPIIVFAFLLISCSSGGGGGGSNSSPQMQIPLKTSTLRTLQTNNSWAYSIDGTQVDGLSSSQSATISFTGTISSTITSSVITTVNVACRVKEDHTIVSANSVTLVDSHDFAYFNQDSTGVYTYGEYSPGNDIHWITTPPYNRLEIRSPVSLGTTTSSNITYSNGVAETRSYTVAAKEYVSIGKNDYESYKIISTVTTTYNGATYESSTRNITSWLVPGLGYIKQHWTEYDYLSGHVLDSVLDYTATLTSTNVSYSSDTEAPTVPAGLSTLPTSSVSITLKWNSSTDNYGVAGYNIFREGTFVGNTTTASFSDTGLSKVTQYCYTVSAYDAAGNESGESAQKCATTALDLSNEFASLAGNEYPSDLAWDGQYLWVANYAEGVGQKKIYKYTMTSGPAIGSIPTPSEWTSSLCFVNSDLWLIDYTTGSMLFKISPSDGSVLASYSIAYSGYFGGSAWDGQFLYYADSASSPYGMSPPSHIYKVDTSTGTVVGTIYTTNGYGIDGLTYKDNSLWFLVTNTTPAKIVNISTAGVELNTVNLPSGEYTGAGVGGLVNINGDLWYLRRNLTEVYAVKFTP